MAICRFFQNGNCKFGNRCFNEHVTGGSGGGGNRNYYPDERRNQYPNQQQQKAVVASNKFSFNQALQEVSPAGLPRDTYRQGYYGHQHQQQPFQPRQEYNQQVPIREGRQQYLKYQEQRQQQMHQSLPHGSSTGGFSFTRALNQIESHQAPSFSSSDQLIYGYQRPAFGDVDMSVTQVQDVSTFGHQPQAAVFGYPVPQQPFPVYASQPVFVQPQPFFVQPQVMPQQPPPVMFGGSFGQQQHQQPPLQNFNTFPAVPVIQDSHVEGSSGGSNQEYSRLEDLTEDEVAAFRSEEFTYGKIPFKPPPSELCYGV